MVPQEREEYEYSKKGEGATQSTNLGRTQRKGRTQGASSPSSASNYAPWPVALTPPLDGDDILRGREVIVATLTHSLRGIISVSRRRCCGVVESDCGPHMEDSHENVPPLLPFMPEACGRGRAHSTRRVGFLLQTVVMDTYDHNGASFPYFAYCIVDSHMAGLRLEFLGQIWRGQEGRANRAVGQGTTN